MSDTGKATVRESVLANTDPADRPLIETIAEQLDSIRNNRLGWNDPVEDWLYDAATVVIDTVRSHDKETRP